MNETAKYVALALVAAQDQHYEEAAVLFARASRCEDCPALVEALSADSVSAGPGVGQETMQDIPQDRLFTQEQPLDRGEQWGSLEHVNGERANKHVTLDDEDSTSGDEGTSSDSDDDHEANDPDDLASFDEDDELAVSTSSLLSVGRDMRRRRGPSVADRAVRILSQSMAAAGDESSSDDSSDDSSDEKEDGDTSAVAAEKGTRSGLYEDNSDFVDEHGGPKTWSGIRHPVADESATLHKNPLIPGRALSLMSDAIPGKELDDHGEPVDDEDVLVPEIDPDIPGTVAIPASFSHQD